MTCPTRPPADTLMRPLESVLRNVVALLAPRIRLAISWAWMPLHMIAVGLHLTCCHSGRNRYCSISVTVPPVRVSAAPLRLFHTDGFTVPRPGWVHLPLPS